ncbi:hypothetical protein F4780DRAFT_672687 [Xylariomycetidae sp. FL0641]|nr:hypothetical protein F4780DRAFT_672687 [Xylariomycetidae sp. FL0641]
MPSRSASTSGRVLRSTRSGGVQKSNPKVLTTKKATRKQQRIKDDGEPDPNTRTRLLILPPELLQDIASYLPLESLVCLTLSCKLAGRTLGNGSWQHRSIRKRWEPDPETGLDHRRPLMELLIRDIAPLGYEMCVGCNTLHPPLRKPGDHRPTKLTKYCWGQDAVIDYLLHTESDRYSLVLAHIRHVLDNTAPESTASIPYLANSFDGSAKNLKYTVTSSGRRIKGNVVLKHEYVFQSNTARPQLRLSHILGLPFRICPHQSTEQMPAQPNMHMDTNPGGCRNTAKRNKPLFTHSLASVFPTSLRTGMPKKDAFQDPSPKELEMMMAANRQPGNCLFHCRACPTKWKVEYNTRNGGELKVTAWHCFFGDRWSALKMWPWFVRREGKSLGPSTRNSEFWSQSRTIRAFEIQ